MKSVNPHRRDYFLPAPSSLLFHSVEFFPGTKPGICSNPGNVSRRHQSNFWENLTSTIIPVLKPWSSHQMWPSLYCNRGKRKTKPNPLNSAKELCSTPNLGGGQKETVQSRGCNWALLAGLKFQTNRSMLNSFIHLFLIRLGNNFPKPRLRKHCFGWTEIHPTWSWMWIVQNCPGKN